MLRCPLESIALRIKTLRLGTIENFLAKAIEPPRPDAIKHVIQVSICSWSSFTIANDGVDCIRSTCNGNSLPPLQRLVSPPYSALPISWLLAYAFSRRVENAFTQMSKIYFWEREERKEHYRDCNMDETCYDEKCGRWETNLFYIKNKNKKKLHYPWAGLFCYQKNWKCSYHCVTILDCNYRQNYFFKFESLLCHCSSCNYCYSNFSSSIPLLLYFSVIITRT